MGDSNDRGNITPLELPFKVPVGEDILKYRPAPRVPTRFKSIREWTEVVRELHRLHSCRNLHEHGLEVRQRVYVNVRKCLKDGCAVKA